MWALDFLYQSKVALGPPQPAVEWVQVYFPGGNAARAGSSYPGLEIHFWSLGSLVGVASVPPAGWYGVRALLGRKNFSLLRNDQTGYCAHPALC